MFSLSHYLWQRQGFGDTPATPATLFGIYGTAPACYLSWWARDPHFTRAALDAVLYEKRTAARIRAMRYSVFTIPAPLLPAVYHATREDPPNPLVQIRKLGFSDADYRAAADFVLALLDGEVLSAAAIKKALPDDLPLHGQARDYIVPMMNAEGLTVRATVRGGWKSDLYDYARFDQWLPGVNLHESSVEAGRAALARHYFDSYGPATADDFRWWSALKKAEAAAAIAACAEEIVPIATDAGQMLIAAARAEAARHSPATPPSGVVLLPAWDAYMMAYKKRTRFLDEAYAEYVYDAVGNAAATVLVNGRVAGVWDFEEGPTAVTLKVALWQDPGAPVWRELEAWLARFAALTGAPAAALMRCAEAPNIKAGKKNLFLAPLKERTGDVMATFRA